MRHVLGVLGVFAAGTLLLVSAAMNWRFGYGLGTTEFDANIYGAASAASDVLKALIPFLILAAMRGRNWSQALGGVLLLAICSSYSLTSSLGFAALNRTDTVNERAVSAATYKDLRAELGYLRKQIDQLPQHRSVGVVENNIKRMKEHRRWDSTRGCTNATVPKSIAYCEEFHGMEGELAAAKKATELDDRMQTVRAKLDDVRRAGPATEADPQAAILANISGLGTDKIQLALVILVSVLVEAGSALGFYVALSHWKIFDDKTLGVPAPVETPAKASLPALVAPDDAELPHEKTDVEMYFDERIEESKESSVTALALFEDYCNWCDLKDKTPVSLPIFGRQFADLGIQKAKIGGRIRYIGIRLLDEEGHDDEKDDNEAFG
ncbi:MAG: hypothetical protein ACLFPA_09475 [Dichotomicrobium sp.]